jgi:hypothetical protein
MFVFAGGSLRIDASGQGSLYVLERAIAAGAVGLLGYWKVLHDETMARK